jgi:hypothetical protein
MAQARAEKQPKPKPPSETGYRRAEIALALSYCPEIHPCRDCQWPVIRWVLLNALRLGNPLIGLHLLTPPSPTPNRSRHGHRHRPLGDRLERAE